MAVHPPYFTELRTAIEHIIYYQKYPTQKRTCSRSLTLLLWKCFKCYLLYWIIFCPIFLLLLIKYVYMSLRLNYEDDFAIVIGIRAYGDVSCVYCDNS